MECQKDQRRKAPRRRERPRRHDRAYRHRRDRGRDHRRWQERRRRRARADGWEGQGGWHVSQKAKGNRQESRQGEVGGLLRFALKLSLYRFHIVCDDGIVFVSIFPMSHTAVAIRTDSCDV